MKHVFLPATAALCIAAGEAQAAVDYVGAFHLTA